MKKQNEKAQWKSTMKKQNEKAQWKSKMKKQNEKAKWKSTMKKHNEKAKWKSTMKKHNETKVKLRKTIIRIKNCYKQKVTMKAGKYYVTLVTKMRDWSIYKSTQETLVW